MQANLAWMHSCVLGHPGKPSSVIWECDGYDFYAKRPDSPLQSFPTIEGYDALNVLMACYEDESGLDSMLTKQTYRDKLVRAGIQ